MRGQAKESIFGNVDKRYDCGVTEIGIVEAKPRISCGLEPYKAFLRMFVDFKTSIDRFRIEYKPFISFDGC